MVVSVDGLSYTAGINGPFDNGYGTSYVAGRFMGMANSSQGSIVDVKSDWFCGKVELLDNRGAFSSIPGEWSING